MQQFQILDNLSGCFMTSMLPCWWLLQYVADVHNYLLDVPTTDPQLIQPVSTTDGYSKNHYTKNHARYRKSNHIPDAKHTHAASDIAAFPKQTTEKFHESRYDDKRYLISNSNSALRYIGMRVLEIMDHHHAFHHVWGGELNTWFQCIHNCCCDQITAFSVRGHASPSCRCWLLCDNACSQTYRYARTFALKNEFNRQSHGESSDKGYRGW